MKQYFNFLLLFFCNLTFYQLGAVDVTTRQYVFEVGEVRTFSPGRIIATSTSSDRTIVDCVAHLGEDKVTFTAMKPGMASWTVSYQDSKGASHGINYVIEVIDINSIAIPNQLTLKIGDTYKFAPIIQDSRMKKYLLEWRSMDESIATINSDYTEKVPIPNCLGSCYTIEYRRGGDLTALKPGITQIVATYKDKSSVCQLIVEPNFVSDIVFENPNIDVKEYMQIQLSPNVLPETATNKELIWTSANPMVAIVNNKGLVTGLQKGKATIMAQAIDGSNSTAAVIVSVVPETKLEHMVEMKINDCANFSTMIEDGNSFTMNLKPVSDKWELREFIVNDSDALAQLNNGSYSVTDVEGPHSISATFAYNGTLEFYDFSGTSGSMTLDDKITLSKDGDVLVISNINSGAIVNIYSVNGQTIGSHKSSDNFIKISLEPSYYIISIDDKYFKIRI